MNEASAPGALQAMLNLPWSRIRKAGNSLKNLLFYSLGDDSVYPRKSLSLSVDRGIVAAAYGSSVLSRISLTAARSYCFDMDRVPLPKDLAASLLLFVNEHRIPEREVTLSIPRAWTVIRTAEFPSTVLENLPAVVSYELDRITPFSADEAFFDYQVLGDDGTKVTIQLTAARTDVLAPYRDALTEGGFTVGRITSNASATGALCRYADGKPDSIVVDISEEDAVTTLFTGGSLSRSLSSTLPPQDESLQADIVERDIRSLLDATVAGRTRPGIVALFRRHDDSMKKLLSQRLQAPVTSISESPVGSRFPAPAGVMTYPAVGGMVETLWSGAKSMDLLSRGARQQQKPPLVISAILAAAIVVMAALYVVAPLRFEERNLAGLTAQIESKKEDVRKVEALKKEAESLQGEITAIAAFKGSRTMTLDIIKELTTVLPDTVWLSRVKITDAGVDIEGYAKSASELLQKLESSPFFRKAEFGSSTVRDARLNTDRFVIKMEIERAAPAPDEKAKGEKAKSEKQ